jgi:glutamate-1-semialdehyde 2,1-aminomutase
MAKRKLNTKYNKLLARAAKVLVGGVNSPVRSFGYAGVKPLFVKSGKGSKIYDHDGNSYIDYVLSWGSLVLGHAHPAVVRDTRRVVASGLSFGVTNDREIELAELIRSAIPFIEKIRFVNSGTEAVMGAIRLARGVTKRDKILKFENSYHGHADYLLAKAGSGLATLSIPTSAGVPKDFTRHTLIAPYGDSDAVDGIFRKHGKEIAAVIVEPVGGNYGVIEPDRAFLEKLRRITKKYGALLIFDEVITGFRFSYGSAAQRFGITPDLICLGKIIGGGSPVGAYGGGANIMDKLAPSGDVYQASTFAGNPVTMQAGISTLNSLRALKYDYARLYDLTRYLCANLKSEAQKRGIGLRINYYGSMFSLKFKHRSDFRRFYGYMLENGVFFAPSEFEANFLSFAHTKKEIDRTLKHAKKAFNYH